MLDPTGHVMSWNPGAERVKGYMAEEVIGQHFSRFYTEEDRAAGVPALALKTAAETGRFAAEGWRVRKDGTLFWAQVIIDPIREDGQLVGFAKVTRDITEQRAAQNRCAGDGTPLPPVGPRCDRLRDLHAGFWTATSPTGMPVQARSKATPSMRSSANTSRASIRPRMPRPASPGKRWNRRAVRGAMNPKGGGSARTARASGPAPSSMRSTVTMAA